MQSMSINKYYVYGYNDPTSTDPYFYIGKGHGNRYLVHFEWNNLKQQTYFYNKLRGMLLKNVYPNVTFLKSGLSEREALTFEIEMINKYGRRNLDTGCLCNLTDGGDGVSGQIYSEETTRKMSISASERTRPYMNIDTKLKITLKNIETHNKPEIIAKKRKNAVARLGHAVLAISPTSGKTVHEFDCLQDAKRKGFIPSSIRQVLSGTRKSHSGYFWREKI